MRRDHALAALARYYPDGIVVAVYQSAFDWLAIRPHPLNYLGTGAMGQASSHALGIALGCPGERVVVLDGDGSLLMNLGSLVTISEQAPRNLWHFVCHNGLYEVNGRYPTPGGRSVDFAAIARAAGIGRVYSFNDLGRFETELGTVLNGDGPVFVSLAVHEGESYPRDYDRIHGKAEREAFRRALQGRL